MNFLLIKLSVIYGSLVLAMMVRATEAQAMAVVAAPSTLTNILDYEEPFFSQVPTSVDSPAQSFFAYSLSLSLLDEHSENSMESSAHGPHSPILRSSAMIILIPLPEQSVFG